MLRSFKATLATPAPGLIDPTEAGSAAALGSARLARLAVFGLALAGILPPFALAARAGELGHIGAVPTAIALIGLLILLPALVGLVTALLGLNGIRDSFRLRGDKEHEQAILRVFVTVAMLGYVMAMAVVKPGDTTLDASQVVAALGLAGAWLLLLLAMIDPAPSPIRYYAGTVADVAVVSAFLHCGADATAPWFPLYLMLAFYAGFRFGPLALAAAAVLSLAGFGATIALTPFWQGQPMLAGGLIAAMIALPAYVGGMARLVAASRAEAAAAQAARTRFLMVISQALRGPLDTIIGGIPPVGRGPHREPETPSVVPAARMLLSQVNNVLDFSAIEAGAFVPSTQAFDLHAVVNDTLFDRRTQAAAKGLKLRLHVDSTLPYRLLGWPQQLRQILDYLVARAIDVTETGAVRVVIDAAGREDRTLHLRLAVRDEGSAGLPVVGDTIVDPFAGAAGDPAGLRRQMAGAGGQGAFGLAVVKRLVQLMEGRITVERGRGKGGALSVVVPLAIDEPAVDTALDLGRCLVLIATEDSQFASDIAEPLNAWQGDPRWIEGFDRALGYVEGREASPCTVLIVDGRTRLLAALSFAHRAASGPEPPSFVLFVAEPSQIDGLIDLSDGEFDGLLPAPLSDQLLANGLHALPLWPGGAARPQTPPLATPAPMPAPEPEPEPELRAPYDPPPVPAAAVAPPQVTSIAAHPRFAADTPTVDARAIAALRGLGGGDEFVVEIVDSFRAEAREIMRRIVGAAAASDIRAFARGLNALRSCAGNVGGTRLCELLLSLREVTGQELREQGSTLVQRLGDELARLDAALAGFLPERREVRR